MSKIHDFSRVTMRDVAKVAGESTMTVSRALRDAGTVNEVTRQKVLNAVKDLGYVPDMTAGSLSSRRSGVVSVLLPSLNNQQMAQTVHVLTEELSKVDMQLLIGHTDYMAEKEEELIDFMLRRRPEALILCYDGHTEKTAQILRNVSIPVIELWDIPNNPIQHTVGFSNFDAAYQLTGALVDKGYRKIGFLGESRDVGTRAGARRKGFIAAMENAGLEAHRIVQREAMPISIEGALVACNNLLDKYADMDCVFCVSDPAAFGAMSALLDRGYSIPKDMGLAGFGDFEISRFSHPPISTIGVDPGLLGKKAAELLLRILSQPGLKNSDPNFTEHLRLKPELKLRGSIR